MIAGVLLICALLIVAGGVAEVYLLKRYGDDGKKPTRKNKL